MENFSEPLPLMNKVEPEASPPGSIFYPPKYQLTEKGVNIWIRSVISLALYLVLGYLIFRRFDYLLLITSMVIFHELGHFFAMKFFRYKDLGIFFIPLLGAYVSGAKREISQRESAIIILAGPLPGIILGIIFYLLHQSNPFFSIGGISYYHLSLLLIFLNLINLLPVYPLDGGQLLNRVFLDEESLVSKLFVLLSAGFLCWVAWASRFPALFIFPAIILFRFIGDRKNPGIEKRIEAEGIQADIDYADLPDKDYWQIRNILIEEYPAFRDVSPSPPFEFSYKEEKIMVTIQHLLHRHLLQDVSVAGKIFLLLIWSAAIASPWLLKMDIPFLHRFGL